MKNIYLSILLVMLMILNHQHVNAQCAVAGTASASSDSICDGAETTLLLTGSTGNIQWQSFNGTTWVNETGTGATTASYAVSPLTSSDYRAYVTLTLCPDDSSNVISIVVGVLPPLTTGATRCGYGPVNLQASGAFTYNWYNVLTGGSVLATGSTYNPLVTATTTFYVEALTGGGNAAPLTTTFAGGNGFDGNMFDIEAINQVTVSSFDCNCTAGSGYAEIWYRPGSYVGFTGSNAGWIFVDSAFITSTGNGIPTVVPININVTIPAGQTIGFYFHFDNSVDYTNGTAVGNVAAQDANIIIREGHGGAYFNLTNQPRIWNGIVYYDAGCTSTRTPVTATVTPSDSATISATSTALCLGTSSTLNAVSTNGSYTYTWSPATGLNTTTGTTVIATPLVPTTYTLVATDGTCGAIDSVFIDVGPASVAGTAFANTDTVCSSLNAFLTLTGYTGNIQWQSNNGSGWVNETGIGSTSASYQINPTQSASYQAIVTSGGCPSATTNTLSIGVITVTPPVTTNDTLCSPGVANLAASGSGILSWYDAPSGGNLINTGTTYNPNVIAPSTFFVEAMSNVNSHVGPPNNGFGSQFATSFTNYGISFDVTKEATIDSLLMYPSTSFAGSVTINLRDGSGVIINTSTINYPANSLVLRLALGFTVAVGTGYQLELGAGTDSYYCNSNNAVYPYTTISGNLTITGYCNPSPQTGGLYYYFYDWVVSDGCSSTRTPVSVVFSGTQPQPTITAAGSLLTSSVAINYQWYFNGTLIVGATSQSYNTTQPGAYTVAVADAGSGCLTFSDPFLIIGIINITTKESGIMVFPNPSSDKFFVQFGKEIKGNAHIRIENAMGQTVYEKEYNTPAGQLLSIENKLAKGTYQLIVKTNTGVYRTAVVRW